MKIHILNYRSGVVLLRLLIGLLIFGGMLPDVTAAPHRYDHVVIVVEENRTPGQIIGTR